MHFLNQAFIKVGIKYEFVIKTSMVSDESLVGSLSEVYECDLEVGN